MHIKVVKSFHLLSPSNIMVNFAIENKFRSSFQVPVFLFAVFEVVSNKCNTSIFSIIIGFQLNYTKS